MIAAAITAAFVLVALGAPWIAPHDPAAQQLSARLAPPDTAHWLGRDEFGRDLLSRIVLPEVHRTPRRPDLGGE